VGEAVVVLDDYGQVDVGEVAVAGDDMAVDHAQGNPGGRAEYEGGDRVVQRAGETGRREVEGGQPSSSAYSAGMRLNFSRE